MVQRLVKNKIIQSTVVCAFCGQQAGDLVALTRQEKLIAEMVAQALPNKVIAARMELAPATVKTHLWNINSKLGLSNRVQLARLVLVGAKWCCPSAKKAHQRVIADLAFDHLERHIES